MRTAPTRRYQIFGLRVASEVELPEAIPDEDPTGAPDLVVRLGSVELPETPPGITIIDGALLLTAPDVGRYRVGEGRDILIDVKPGVPDKNVRLYLLGSAIGAALHQRGLLPLHANAVEIDGAAVAFVGETGAGKSTLAGWFYDHGHRVLSDDVCVVQNSSAGPPLVYPAVRRLRLCRDALLASGRATDRYDPSFSGDPEFDKFDVPLPHDSVSPVALATVVLLEFGPVAALQLLSGVEAAQVLFDHTYRGGMVEQIGNAELHWQAVTRVLPKAKVVRWTRLRDRRVLDVGVEGLIAALRTLSDDGGDQALGRQVS